MGGSTKGIERAGRLFVRRAALLLALGTLLPWGTVQGQTRDGVPPEERQGVQALSWIAGCWEMQTGGRVTTERWAGSGDVLLGTSHSTSDDRTVGWEFLRLAEGESGTITYYAHPSGQAPAAFEATVVTPDSVIFSNPAHDFPQSITYRRRPDSLVASITGETPSGEREIFFSYRRIPCEAHQ